MSGPIYVLRIEEAGGVRPWVAQVAGLSLKFGIRRAFVSPSKDWRHARRNMSGRLRGVVSVFALREGWVVEVCRPDRKGRELRYFARVTPTGLDEITAEEAMAWAAAQDEQIPTSAP